MAPWYEKLAAVIHFLFNLIRLGGSTGNRPFCALLFSGAHPEQPMSLCTGVSSLATSAGSPATYPGAAAPEGTTYSSEVDGIREALRNLSNWARHREV